MEEGIQEVKRTVPKFASFRPKSTQRPAGNEDRSPSIKYTSTNDTRASLEPQIENGGRIRSPDHNPETRHRHGSGRHKHRHSRARKKGKSTPDGLRSPPVIGWSQDEAPELFGIDTTGDPANLTYGTLHRYVIPSYFRSGAGSVLGLRSSQKIDQHASSEKNIVLSSNRYNTPKKTRAELAKANLRGNREMRIRPNAYLVDAADHQVDFLALREPRPKKRKRGIDGEILNAVSSSDEANDHYRSIDGKAKPLMRPDDLDLEYDSDTSMSNDESRRVPWADQELRQTTIKLSRRVHEDSGSVDAWLDLINHQDKVVGLGQDLSRSKATSAEKLSTADIKLSMYEEALGKVMDPQAQELLVLGMIEEGSKIWDTKKLSAKWRTALQNNPGHVGLWAKYLDFRQTTFTIFRFDEVRNVYIECFEVLRQARFKIKDYFMAHESLYEIQIYILLRLTLLMREAGFPENATALWQALLEYSLFMPEKSENSDSTGKSSRLVAIKDFEEFWESEVLRIGEEGAHGWADFVSRHGNLPEAKHVELQAFLSDEIGFKSWADKERQYAMQVRAPARTIDDVEEDDPYRVILFSDVREFLIDPPPLSNQNSLVPAFLSFCHLPPLSYDYDSTQSERWWRDSFIRNEVLHDPEYTPRHWGTSSSDQKGFLSHPQTEPRPSTEIATSFDSPFSFPMPCYLTSNDSLFAATHVWFSAFDEFMYEYSQNAGPVELGWMYRILKALVDRGVGGNTFAIYVLAFECKAFPDAAEKSAKKLLKKQSSNLRLYNAYALIQYRLGKFTAAETVIIKAINMGKQLDETAQRDAILLWRTWLWELLRSGLGKEALTRLLTYADREISVMSDVQTDAMDGALKVPPAALLRTQRALTDGRDLMLSLGCYTHYSLYAECLVLLAYLCNAQSLDAALSLFTSNVALLTSRLPHTSSTHEHLHQTRAKLLHYHITHTHAFKPSLVRLTLAESIRLFPQNTIFLSLYSWNESRFRIDDRVRSIIQDVVLANHDSTVRGNQRQDSVISHFFAIYTELNRGVALGSNTNTIRGTFERAVATKCGRQSAGLWKLYVMFEYSRGEFDKAKGVFYRAIQACPWVKGLYMLAFEQLGDAIGAEELRGVYETMVEKELRVHVSLEEVFARMDERGK